MEIENIVEQFDLGGEVTLIESYGNGHINDTYLVETEQGAFRYILQRINTSIFKKPEELMVNILSVTGFLRQKIAAAGGDPKRGTLTVIPTKTKQSFYKTPEGKCYRVYLFIENTRELDEVITPDSFYAAAEAFGNFGYMLSDYPADTLHMTIPDFHDTGKRYQRFLDVAAADPLGRAKKVGPEIAFLKARAAEMPVLTDMLSRGELPLRVTHNDTKSNNILLDKTTGKGLCIIDLDTVMPGTVLWDFGDSIRFGASTAAEDERDLSLVKMDITLFSSYVKGYIAGFCGLLRPEEIRLLPMGAKIMTLESGVRFLTDYLEGDVYFKIHRDGHNLDRCRTQLKLVEDMEEKWEQMTQIAAESL